MSLQTSARTHFLKMILAPFFKHKRVRIWEISYRSKVMFLFYKQVE